MLSVLVNCLMVSSVTQLQSAERLAEWQHSALHSCHRCTADFLEERRERHHAASFHPSLPPLQRYGQLNWIKKHSTFIRVKCTETTLAR